MALQLSVVPSRVLKWPINPISNPNLVYSHTLSRDNNITLNVHYYRNILPGKRDDLLLLRRDYLLTK
jgi:hypothetical protein